MEAKSAPTLTLAVNTMGITRDKPVLTFMKRGSAYCVRRVDWCDTARQAEYQRLRAQIFVEQRHWDLPLEADGRECDRYDVGGGRNIQVYTVYSHASDTCERLLGGVRVFTLRHWDESMLAHEFVRAGTIPAQAVDEIRAAYRAEDLIELTRLCVVSRSGRSTAAPRQPNHTAPRQADFAVARDLVYAGAYTAAAVAGRVYAIGLTDELYARVMRRSHFVFETLYTQPQHRLNRCSVVLIDLVKTIQTLRAAGEFDRAARMLLGCPPGWA